MKHIAMAALAVLLGALAFASPASAGTRTDEFDITVESVPQCTMWDFWDSYEWSWNPSGSTISSMFSVVCNQDLPYNVEIDSNPGAKMNLVDSAIGEQVEIDIYITHNNSPLKAWGSLANGEQFENIGTGIWQVYLFGFTQPMGPRPKAGIYTRHATVTLNF